MKTAPIPASAFFAASAFALAFAAQSANSAIIVTQPTPITTACSTTEMTLTNSAPPAGGYADYCIGYTASPGSPTDETTLLNNSTDGSDWTFAYKAEGTPELGSTLSGIKFTLTGMTFNADNGVYTIAWEDTNGSEPYNLPLYVDLAFGMKAGSDNSGAGIGYFLFDDYLLTNNPYQASGTFDLIVNKDLSHSSLFVRYERTPDLPPDETPEPGILLLMGAGLLGLGMARRRKSA